jgi:hypothetical protein
MRSQPFLGSSRCPVLQGAWEYVPRGLCGLPVGQDSQCFRGKRYHLRGPVLGFCFWDTPLAPAERNSFPPHSQHVGTPRPGQQRQQHVVPYRTVRLLSNRLEEMGQLVGLQEAVAGTLLELLDALCRVRLIPQSPLGGSAKDAGNQRQHLVGGPRVFRTDMGMHRGNLYPGDRGQLQAGELAQVPIEYRLVFILGALVQLRVPLHILGKQLTESHFLAVLTPFVRRVLTVRNGGIFG